MIVLMAVLVGVLCAGGVYLLLRRQMISVLLGLLLVSYSLMLLLFATGGVHRGRVPVLPPERAVTPSDEAAEPPAALGDLPDLPDLQDVPAADGENPWYVDALQAEVPLIGVDPVPQVLVLLVLVGGFSIFLVIIALAQRAHQVAGRSDMDDVVSPGPR
jgi:multisubunit Na+/H+ antiporter MnhC subunit